MTGIGSAKTKALDAWTELNDRQQGTLAVIYDLDQEDERGRRADAARGNYDKTPAAEWRLLDFAHDPSLRKTARPHGDAGPAGVTGLGQPGERLYQGSQ